MIHFFCALSAEAKPLLQHFKLVAVPDFQLFRLYQSDDQQYSLTITGLGACNAAAAVSYHYAVLQPSASDIWLNIGIAGGSCHPLGSGLLINKITAYPTQQSWYPQLLFQLPCPAVALISLAAPSGDYGDALFDLEGAGFYQLASKLGSQELIHSFKVVADNQAHPELTINGKRTQALIAANIKTIETILAALKPLAATLATLKKPPAHYQQIIQQWHFSYYQRRQLSQLLRNWSLRFPDKDVIAFIAPQPNSQMILTALQHELIEFKP